MKPVLLCLGLFALANALSAQTCLTGKVTVENFEPLPYASVALYKNRVLITGAETDMNGDFLLEDIDPGIYDVQVSYIAYRTKNVSRVKVYAGKTNRLQVCMSSDAVTIHVIEVTAPWVSRIDADYSGCGTVLRASEKETIKPEPPNRFSTLRCFPNPTVDQVTIVLTDHIKQLQLYSLSGQLLRQWGSLEAGQQTINLSNYPSGTYLLEATAKGHRWVAKIIVQR
jgi:hypothetical protein